MLLFYIKHCYIFCGLLKQNFFLCAWKQYFAFLQENSISSLYMEEVLLTYKHPTKLVHFTISFSDPLPKKQGDESDIDDT